jgi:hypothetical protein
VPEVDSCDVLVLGREILKVVADEHFDLVLMGVQGKGVVNRLVFGSTTHRVIREAACTVLTLHTGAALACSRVNGLHDRTISVKDFAVAG